MHGQVLLLVANQTGLLLLRWFAEMALSFSAANKLHRLL